MLEPWELWYLLLVKHNYIPLGKHNVLDKESLEKDIPNSEARLRAVLVL